LPQKAQAEHEKGEKMSAPSEAGANCPEREAHREWPKTNRQAITDYTYREATNGMEL
jgi:hypothetical protein